MEVKQRGKILAHLTLAYATSNEPFVKKRIEKAIYELCVDLTADSYKELVDGYLDTNTPLELLMYTSKLLPDQPTLAEMPGRGEGFYVGKDQDRIRTIIGTNEAGKKLINNMINEVKQRGREAKKSENLKNNKEWRG